MQLKEKMRYEAPEIVELAHSLAFGADGGDSTGPGDNDNDLPELP